MLAYTNARPLSKVATIKDECPFANCTVGFDATVWSPQIGMKLSSSTSVQLFALSYILLSWKN